MTRCSTELATISVACARAEHLTIEAVFWIDVFTKRH
jgi:hypothetical protein